MAEQRSGNGPRFANGATWKWLAAFVIAIVGIIGVGLATSNGNSSPSARGLRNDELTQMEHQGTMQAMLRQHQNMMEQMRAGLSPQMLQLMDDDPMWKAMRSGDFTQMMQDQQQQIDRMLGRGAP